MPFWWPESLVFVTRTYFYLSGMVLKVARPLIKLQLTSKKCWEEDRCLLKLSSESQVQVQIPVESEPLDLTWGQKGNSNQATDFNKNMTYLEPHKLNLAANSSCYKSEKKLRGKETKREGLRHFLKWGMNHNPRGIVSPKQRERGQILQMLWWTQGSGNNLVQRFSYY